MALVSDDISNERSLEAESMPPLQHSPLLGTNLPGPQGLDQADVLPNVVTRDDETSNPLLAVMGPLDTGTHTHSEVCVSTGNQSPVWFTPPQSPSGSMNAVHTNPPMVNLPPESLYVYGSVEDQTTLMLVDTGATITAVSNAFFYSLSPLPQLTASILPSIRTVSGESLPVRGTATLTFVLDTVPYSFAISVIDTLTYPVVLGRDFLMHFNSVIDMQSHTLTLSGNTPISLGPDRTLTSPTHGTSTESATVHAYATYILPPLSENIIPVYAKADIPIGSIGFIEPNSKLAERYQICGAAQLVSLADTKTFPFRVLNPTNRPITVYRCSTMGTFTRSDAFMSVITTEDNPPVPAQASSNDDQVPLDLSDSTLTDDEQSQLKSLVADYRDIFALSPAELGRTGLVKHSIDTGNNPPIRQRPYRVSDKQRGIIEEHVTDMLNRGIIQPSVSPWASPVVLVKKKDNTDRFCVDFRRVNAVTRKDSYLLPRIDDTLDALNGTRYFTTMDLISGYWQVEMDAAYSIYHLWWPLRVSRNSFRTFKCTVYLPAAYGMRLTQLKLQNLLNLLGRYFSLF